MDNVSSAVDGVGNPDERSIELAKLLTELVRHGWRLTIQPIPNDWGAMAEAEIVFENTQNQDPPRTLKEDMDAVAHGLPSQVPVHWKFDPFDPLSLYKAVKRFHELFGERVDLE